MREAWGDWGETVNSQSDQGQVKYSVESSTNEKHINDKHYIEKHTNEKYKNDKHYVEKHTNEKYTTGNPDYKLPQILDQKIHSP